MTRRRIPRGLPLLASLLVLSAIGCGKRADPLPPYVKTPRPPTGLEVSQVGASVEIRIFAPRTTAENRTLPVIKLEWLQAPPTGDFGNHAISLLQEEVAPGELRVKTFKLPAAPVRFAVRAINGKARSGPSAPLAFTPAPVPSPPTSVQAVNTTAGVELRWSNPPGAEPWPTPTPTPTPSPSPTASPSPAGALSTAPSPSPPPSSTPTPTPAPVPAPTATPGEPPSSTTPTLSPAGSPSPTPKPTPSPTPTPTPSIPTGIRIFRTDGAERLARPPLQASSWLDSTPRTGETPCYSLRYATSFKPLVESAPTEPVCVEVKDLVPPEPPERVFADIGDTFVEISWPASSSGDVAFYRVYRTADWEARAMIIETEGQLLRVRDLRMTPGSRTYEVTAVDKAGNESRPSESVKLTVP